MRRFNENSPQLSSGYVLSIADSSMKESRSEPSRISWNDVAGFEHCPAGGDRVLQAIFMSFPGFQRDHPLFLIANGYRILGWGFFVRQRK
jgi:hypothetical protein